MYHFIGIKGTGMSALAIIMKELGYLVSGSDLDKHFFTEEELIKNNIPVYVYNEFNIHDDLIIIKGASITDDNVELIKAKELNLKIINYNEMVGILTEKIKTICVSGCHGKTTTTKMIAHVLDNILGINYLVGDGTGYAKKDNNYFALESCEYRRHFLAYNPYYTIILNIDLDHVDYFKDIDDVILAYQELANKSNKMIIANGDDINVKKMHLNKPVTYFGFSKNNNVRAEEINYLATGTNFKVYVDNKLYGSFETTLYGEHQVYDALALITVAYYEGIEADLVNKYLKTFTGAKRRFSETIIGNNIVIDDYAHHPNEIKSTINAIKQKYPYKTIISIFQPHTYTRTKEFASDFAKVLSETDVSYIMDIHPAREKQEDYPDVTKELIIKKMKKGYGITIDDTDTLSKYDNAVFIFMSPNDISYLINNLKEALKNKNN